MEIKDVIILLREKIKMKNLEISRMERDVAIAKSHLNNDIRSLMSLLQNHYPKLIEAERIEIE